jgi:UDP-N-acetylglucosamine diphosphorylase/glucosamine-1-phosphate N-acetyltransferase
MRARLMMFEDAATRHFAPLTHTRPVYELMCGLMSLRERCERAFGSEAILVCRTHLGPPLAETTGRRVNELGPGSGPLVLVNGRLLHPYSLVEHLDQYEGPGTWWNGDELIAARIPAGNAGVLMENLDANGHLLEPGMLGGLPVHVEAEPLVERPWELVRENGARIERDVQRLGLVQGGSDLEPGVHQVGDGPLIVAPGAVIEPGTVLDTSNGPIVLGRGARVAGLTRIEGPTAVGAASQLVGGRIRAGTTIGPGCRVAGEVEASIFQGHSNKYHDGFIGHTYIGEWVNLGAMTTNSDLKNTYGTVKVWREGQLVDTGEQKVGALIGDHTKTGIGSLIDTGTVIGVAANVYGGGAVLATKWVPSFAWGAPPRLTLHDPERAMVTMEEVMRRRGATLTEAYREMMDEVFSLTRPEREFARIHEI